MRQRPLIICIGLPKTGTTSLCAALSECGYSNIIHCPHRLAFEDDEIQKATLEQADVVAEIFGLLDFRKLKEWFPDAKLICTEREILSWLDSCSRQFASHLSADEIIYDGEPLRRGRELRFGQPYFSEEKFREIYNEHTLRVTEYLETHPDEEILRFNVFE